MSTHMTKCQRGGGEWPDLAWGKLTIFYTHPSSNMIPQPALTYYFTVYYYYSYFCPLPLNQAKNGMFKINSVCMSVSSYCICAPCDWDTAKTEYNSLIYDIFSTWLDNGCDWLISVVMVITSVTLPMGENMMLQLRHCTHQHGNHLCNLA